MPSPKTGHLLIILLVTWVLGGCSLLLLTMKGSVDEDDPDLPALYTAAIEDAAVVDGGEIKPLRAIHAGRVKLVAWVPRDRLRVGAFRLKEDLWVSKVPELQEKCAGYKGNLVPRLKQLLGLRLNAERHELVELEADSVDLFRPCPDPDPSRESCGTTVPEDVPPKYLAWFAAHSANAHRKPGGSPFTGLGYTYDWNPETGDYGVSEYVVRGEAWVDVLSVVDTREYCEDPAMTPITPIIKRLD
ncbi:MAG: hypothetical protein ACPGUC_00620 [Gammaproteobacteria bacterium]